jgi:hypothetical protein
MRPFVPSRNTKRRECGIKFDPVTSIRERAAFLRRAWAEA